MAIGQINFATIQRLDDVNQFRQQQDSKSVVDQQNIQGQVEQRADKLRHQVMNKKNEGKPKNDADAREEGKNKYTATRKLNKKKKEPSEGNLDREIALLQKVGSGIDIKI
jgi:hypothetical protein